MVKRFLYVILVVVMAFSCCSFATGEAADVQGDEYLAQDELYPSKAKFFMTEEEIQAYEDFGWTWETGAILYFLNDSNTYEAVNLFEVNEETIDQLFDQGIRLGIFYTWVCPGELLDKHMEQSVSCGWWQLNREQTKAYYIDYQYPELNIDASAKTATRYESNWAKNGKYCSDPTGEEPSEVLDELEFVRLAYNEYDRGRGEVVLLLNGDVEVYSFDEVVQIGQEGGFDGELFKWE